MALAWSWLLGAAPAAGQARATASYLTARARIEPTPAQAIATSLADVALGVEVVGRRFEYRNGIAPQPYVNSVAAAPAGVVGGQLFPLAGRRALWRDVGIVASCSMMFSTASVVSYPLFYSIGLRVRIHPGQDPRAILGVSFAYDFASLRAVGSPTAELPAVTYRSLRPAVDARLPFGKVSVLVGTALRVIADPSGISTQFYRPSALGFDAEVGGAFMFVRRLELRAIASYQRDTFSFRPPSGSTLAAGGAVDQRYGVGLALAYVY